jgi:hypothetical protein
LQSKEERRIQRPIKLYITAFEQEEIKRLNDELFPTPTQREKLAEQFLKNVDRMEEIKEKARVDLTPEEREQEEIEEILFDLKNIPTMSEKINYMEETVSLPLRFKLISQNEKFMAPIIIGTMKRPYRLAKARESIERIFQKRQGENQPHK